MVGKETEILEIQHTYEMVYEHPRAVRQHEWPTGFFWLPHSNLFWSWWRSESCQLSDKRYISDGTESECPIYMYSHSWCSTESRIQWMPFQNPKICYHRQWSSASPFSPKRGKCKNGLCRRRISPVVLMDRYWSIWIDWNYTQYHRQRNRGQQWVQNRSIRGP